jgi:hypothetical protein
MCKKIVRKVNCFTFLGIILAVNRETHPDTHRVYMVPEVAGRPFTAEGITIGEFTSIYSRNVSGVAFMTVSGSHSHRAHSDIEQKPPLYEIVSEGETRQVPQFQIELESALDREQMALALIGGIDSIRLQIGIMASDIESRKARVEQHRRNFYRQNKEIVDSCLDLLIAQVSSEGGVLRGIALPAQMIE